MAGGLLSTESLLGIIAFLLLGLNVNTQLLKNAINRLNKKYDLLTAYFKKDIQIRSRLERKADWIMRKFGRIDIEKFNIDAEDTISDEEFDT